MIIIICIFRINCYRKYYRFVFFYFILAYSVRGIYNVRIRGSEIVRNEGVGGVRRGVYVDFFLGFLFVLESRILEVAVGGVG